MEIINKLDVEALHQEVEETGAVIIKNLLREEVAEEALRLAGHKLPVMTKFVVRGEIPVL